jgi:hypothetical protein
MTNRSAVPGSGSGFRVTEWTELQSAAERTTYEAKFSF